MTEAPFLTVKAWRRHTMDDSVNQSVMTVFLEQPLALPGSANKIQYIWLLPLNTQ